MIPEFDADGGMLFPAGDFDIVNGELKLLTGSVNILRGQDLVKSASAAISDSMESFKAMVPLRSEVVKSHGAGFEMSQNTGTFLVTSYLPISPSKPTQISLDNVESLWQDKKLTHVKNFQFMPPVNKGSKKQLRSYAKLQQPAPQTYGDLQSELGADDPSGETGVGPPIDITFTRTSNENNLVCQVWEVCSGSINKLRAIDFGEFEDEDPYSPGKHVFFVGKLFDDDSSDKTFVNLFTMVFD